MPEWGLLLIQLCIIAAVGLFFWNVPFICALGTAGFSIWLMVMSVKTYGDITWGEWAVIEVHRFVCVFGIASFAIEEVYRFKQDDGSIIEFVFTPDTFIGAAWKAAVVGAGSILIMDFIIPLITDGFFTTFRYGLIFGIIFAVPSLILIVLEIRNFIIKIRG